MRVHIVKVYFIFSYIATMGPTHPDSFSNKLPIDFDDGDAVDTCPDFWKLCWSTKAQLVIMLCTISSGFRGCSRYFPEGDFYNQTL